MAKIEKPKGVSNGYKCKSLEVWEAYKDGQYYATMHVDANIRKMEGKMAAYIAAKTRCRQLKKNTPYTGIKYKYITTIDNVTHTR